MRQREWGVVEGAGLLPRKKNHFVPKMMSLPAVLNRQKTRTFTISFGIRILRMNREMLTKTVQKLSKNSRSGQGRGRSQYRPPPLNTPLETEAAAMIAAVYAHNFLVLHCLGSTTAT